MWDSVAAVAARAPGPEALRFHRLELLEVDRRRRAGLPVEPELAAAHCLALATELAVPAMLERARAAWHGALVLVKGPEVAVDYPAPATRPFGDLDLLTDDAQGAQRALLAAGFLEVGEPALYEGIHHLRPLWWPGLPLVIELHSRPKWPAGVPGPPVAELLDAAVASRTGVAGIAALPAAHHALLLAAHAWAHEPLARLGHLIDVAATLQRADPAEVDALARRWNAGRLWRTTQRAAVALLDGEGGSAALATWARHLAEARERTVLEAHVEGCVAPLWGLPAGRASRAAIAALARDLRRDGREPWSTKLSRTRLAFRHAGVARSEHDRALEGPLATMSTSGGSTG